jgi:hypothetical protein
MVPDDDRTSGDRTRRDLLRTGAGAFAVGTASFTAGCTGALPPLGSEQRFGRVDVPAADPPTYRRWLPARSAVDDDGLTHYPFLFRRPTALDYPAPVRFTTPRKRLLTDLDHFGVGYANYDRLLETPFGTAIEADVDADAVADTLTGSGYRADGTYAGYDLFVRSDVRRRAAVTDGAVVWSSRRVHERPNVEALVDAGEGRIARYHEESDAFARLGDAIGESRMVEFIPPDGERRWSKCEGFRFDGETAYHVMTFLYPEGETPPEDELRERSKEGTILTREVENADFRTDGRLVTVEGKVPPAEGIPPSEIHPPYPPQVTWGYGRDDDAGTATVRHEAGPAIPTDDLALHFEVATGPERYARRAVRPLPTVLERLGSGDSVTVDLDDVPSVTVIDEDDVDFDAEDPYADGEPRRPTRIDLVFSPAGSYRTLFSVELEGSA